MESVPVKQPDDTIAAYLDKLNDATSLTILNKLEHEPTSNVGWIYYCTPRGNSYISIKYKIMGVSNAEERGKRILTAPYVRRNTTSPK